MNIKGLIQIACNLLPEQRKQQVQQALARAEEILANRQVNSAADARKVLNELGVQGGFIEKLMNFTNSPLANTLFNVGGINKNGLLNDLESLKGGNTTPQIKPAISDDLSRFRADLARLSKKEK